MSKLNAQINTTKQELENIKRNLEIVNQNLILLKNELTRKKTLSEKGMISQQEVDNSERKYLTEKNSKANYQNQRDIIPLKINELKAALDIRQAELEDARLTLRKSVIKAPFNAIVYDKSVEISQVISSGQTTGTLIDDSVWEVPVDLDIKYIENLTKENFQQNMSTQYTCEVFWEGQQTTFKWQGYISHIEKINQKTRTARIIVEVLRDKTQKVSLSKGMFCRVILPGKKYSDAVVIPASALRNDNKVYIVNKGKLVIKSVKILQRQPNEVIIGDGLSPGDKVIISALPNPVIGMPLQAG